MVGRLGSASRAFSRREVEGLGRRDGMVRWAWVVVGGVVV